MVGTYLSVRFGTVFILNACLDTRKQASSTDAVLTRSDKQNSTFIRFHYVDLEYDGNLILVCFNGKEPSYCYELNILYQSLYSSVLNSFIVDLSKGK